MSKVVPFPGCEDREGMVCLPPKVFGKCKLFTIPRNGKKETRVRVQVGEDAGFDIPVSESQSFVNWLCLTLNRAQGIDESALRMQKAEDDKPST